MLMMACSMLQHNRPLIAVDMPACNHHENATLQTHTEHSSLFVRTVLITPSI